MTPAKEKKIKVLFLTKWYPHPEDLQFGIFVKKHAQAVAPFVDVAVLYIMPFPSKSMVTDFYITEEKNVMQFHLYYKKSSWKMINLMKHYLTFRRGWKAVIKNFGTPGLVHANILTRPGVMAYLIKISYHIHYIITEHWTGYVSNKFNQKPSWYRWLTRFVVKHADSVTAVSQSLKIALERVGFQNAISVIPNVVDLPPETGPQIPGKIKFLTVADLLDEQKNISSTIRVAARLARKGYDFEFHIIGGGPDDLKLQMLTEETGLKNSFIFFHGRKNNEDVYDIMKKINFVVVNSNHETFSIVTAEGLACGKPVIATISGGPEEILTEEMGLLIEKDNDLQLENAIEKMFKTYMQYDPEKLRAFVTDYYSRLKIGKSLYSLYQNVLQKKKVSR